MGHEDRNIRKLFFEYPTSNIFFSIYGLYRLSALKEMSFVSALGYNSMATHSEVPFLAKLSFIGKIASIPVYLKKYRSHYSSVYFSECDNLGITARRCLDTSVRVKLLKIVFNADTDIITKCILFSVILRTAIRAIFASRGLIVRHNLLICRHRIGSYLPFSLKKFMTKIVLSGDRIIRKVCGKLILPFAYYSKRSQNNKMYRAYLKDWELFKAKCDNSKKRFPLDWNDRYPIVNEKTTITPYDRHYTYHPAWAARILSRIKPVEHIDIGSLLIFSVLISAFIPTRFYDYRPAKLELENYTSGHADLTNLPFEDRSIHSLSCMHVLEHVGLGRYGDPIDPDGDIKAFLELQRVLAIGGNLLVVVPVGKPRIMFNAHRIYGYQDIINILQELSLVEFALIPDSAEDGGLVYDALPDMINVQNYACGCYWFTRTA